MIVIGLTGGIGSGKSTVAQLFSKRGVTVIDSDQLARDVTQKSQPALQQIAKQFGQNILHEDGSLNRSHLRKLIFDNPSNRIWLEKLLHPLIRKKMKYQTKTAKSSYCIVVIPLLLETKPNPLINRILVIDTSKELQISRAMNRDNASLQEVKAILKTQVSREKRLGAADDVIENNGTLKDLIPQVEKLHQLYLSLAAKS